MDIQEYSSSRQVDISMNSKLHVPAGQVRLGARPGLVTLSSGFKVRTRCPKKIKRGSNLFF